MRSAHIQPSSRVDLTVRCSVIVPVYNGGLVVRNCLDALAKQTVAPAAFEIIVVDDGSTDDTVWQVEDWAENHPCVSVLVVEQDHAGPASARNRGALVAKAPVLLFTDADCRPTPHWMDAMLSGFENDDPPAGLMGVYCSDQTALPARFAQIEFQDRYERMAGRPELDVVATYSAAFRRDLFLVEGGFDPSFTRANNEDVEFSYRLSEEGYRMAFVPEAQVYHNHAESWTTYAYLKAGRGFWRTLVYRRHPGKALKDTYTPQVLKLQIVLAPLATLGLLLALLGKRRAGAGLALPFLATTLPFVSFAARRDRGVALAAPWGLWLRSIAFAAGVAVGVLASLRGQPELPEQLDEATE